MRTGKSACGSQGYTRAGGGLAHAKDGLGLSRGGLACAIMRDLIDIARMEEARITEALTENADVSEVVLGGRMCRGTPGLWCNAAVGLGLDRAYEPAEALAEMRRLIAWYEAAGIEPRIELAPFAHDAVRAAIEAERFVLRMFELVLYRELAEGETVRTVHACPADVSMEVVDPGDERLLRACAEVVIPGFKALVAGIDDAATADEVAFFLRQARHPKVLTIAARLRDGGGPDGRGRVVAVGGAEFRGSVGAVFGAVTVRDQRRRGIQQALLARRLNEISARGVRVATIGSRPDVATYRNAMRMGFVHAYTKVVMVRPGAGLVPVTA